MNEILFCNKIYKKKIENLSIKNLLSIASVSTSILTRCDGD